jgi:uncharacterized membrane protein YuzA (DUF378 family)
MDNFLNTLSINQSVLESVVIFGLLALIFGTILVMFWKYIVAGLAAVFCVMVLANHKSPQPADSVPVKVEQSLKSTEKLEEKPLQNIEPQTVVPTPPVTEVKPFDEHQAFMEDCVRLTNYEAETCEQMWTDRESGNAQDVKYRKNKPRYIKARS